MNDEKKPGLGCMKVFLLSLLACIGIASSLWCCIGWLVAMFGGAEWFLLYIPAIVILSLCATVMYSLFKDGVFDEW